VAAVPAAASAADRAPVVKVVASGLNAPRHLSFGPGGLYIPEAGTGGGGSCGTPGDGSLCAGPTASVSVLGAFGRRTVLSGLPSVINPGEGAFGPAAVVFDRGRLATVFQNTTVNQDGSSVRGPGAELFGKVVRAWPFSGPSGWSVRADVTGFAAAHPQDPGTIGGPPGENVYESNPYDIVPYAGGFAIADAAANDVLYLSPQGGLSLVSRLPTTPQTVPAGILGPDPVTIDAQAVPTSLAVGPDGALYVATLPGFPALAGTAKVYRLRSGQQPVAVVTGLTEVTDISFDRQGRLLVLEYNTGGGLAPPTTPGALLRVSRTGAVSTLPVDGLSGPTGLAVGRDSTVYIANKGNGPAGSGEVLKITGLA
jgi:hypothetical protein